jgi:hypothetical protein
VVAASQSGRSVLIRGCATWGSFKRRTGEARKLTRRPGVALSRPGDPGLGSVTRIGVVLAQRRGGLNCRASGQQRHCRVIWESTFAAQILHCSRVLMDRNKKGLLRGGEREGLGALAQLSAPLSVARAEALDPGQIAEPGCVTA